MLERLFSDVSMDVAAILDGALSGKELTIDDAERLMTAQGADLHALMRAADVARIDDNGDDVSYVVCRNLNFTNVCYVGYSFCGFARHADTSAEDMAALAALGYAGDTPEVGAQRWIDPECPCVQCEHWR